MRIRFKALSLCALAALIPGADVSAQTDASILPKPGTEITRDYSAPIKQDRGGPTGSGIMYITEKIPEIKAPTPAGQYYEATIPDTLDLAERCALAVHGITSCTDPASDYEIYGGSPVGNGVLTLAHSYHDYNGGQPKWIENLPLLRNASGSKENLIVDQKLMEQFFHMLGPDGLYWIPVQGSAWRGSKAPNDLFYFKPNGKQTYNSWPIGRALMTLAAWYQAQGDPIYKEATVKMVDGLASVAQTQGDQTFFYEVRTDNDIWTTHPAMSGGIRGTCNQTSIMNGLASAYRVTKYEPAKTMNDRLIKFLFDPANHMYVEGGGWATPVHFHGLLFGIMGMLDLGLDTGNKEYVETARKNYEFGKEIGVPVIGWFPEGYVVTHPKVETCQTADMTIFAVKLSEAGVGDYWDDVEHYTRNHLQACQVTDTWWMKVYAAQAGAGAKSQTLFEANDMLTSVSQRPASTQAVDAGTTLPLSSDDRVAERILGTFPGYCHANGYIAPGGAMSCCTGNGARALFFAWRHILDEKDGELKVNLLLNRASKWADVNSYMPYTGKVEVKMKTAENLKVRIPSWVNDGEEKCSVNGAARQCPMEGRYLAVGAVKAGEAITIEFPLKRETQKIKCFDKEYIIDLRGYNIVDIWPKNDGMLTYFYNRDDWRHDAPRLKTVTRFAPDHEIDW